MSEQRHPLVQLQALERAGTVDGGRTLRLVCQDTAGVTLGIDVPWRELGKLYDWAASGRTRGAREQGLPPTERIMIDLDSFELGEVAGEPEMVFISMRFGEEGMVTYRTSRSHADALLEGLSALLRPGTISGPAGPLQ